MGCTESKDMTVLETLRAKYPKMLSVLELQQYSRDLALRFIEFDRTGTLHLKFEDFIKFAGVPKNRVTSRMFAVCDADGSGTLDFREACYLIWQLCTLDDKGLIAFLFDLYDEFSNDLVEYDDVERMLGDAYGTANLEEDDMQELIEFVKERGVLTRPEFNDFCLRTPQVVRVIMDTQRRMRQAILGSAVWTTLERKRKMKTDPVFQPANWSRLIEKIIVMDIESRDEQERMARLQELKTGKRVKRINIKGVNEAEQEGHERYEP